MEKDIDFLSKPIDHFTGEALILARMRWEHIRQNTDSSLIVFYLFVSVFLFFFRIFFF
ncbi:hypothetical protein Hanom_Chr00s098856g01802771 [Helianthus anomalus]